MLNNGITSLTCIHREAGIKPSAQREREREREKRKEGKKGKRIEMESGAIKNRSAAYLLKKWRPGGEEGRKGMRREAVAAKSGEREGRVTEGKGGVGRQSDVFNFFCC